MKMIRCFVLAVSASLALAGCQVKEEKTGGPSPVRVKVMKVALSEQKTSGRFSGTVEEAGRHSAQLFRYGNGECRQLPPGRPGGEGAASCRAGCHVGSKQL